MVLSALLTLAFGIYFSRATHALRNVLVALQSRPYHEMRQSRHNVKLQVRAFCLTLRKKTTACTAQPSPSAMMLVLS